MNKGIESSDDRDVGSAAPRSIVTEAMRFSVGIEEIDEEHRELFKCLDAINTSLHSEFSFSAAFQALETLTDYTRTHFRVEECLMRLMGYPGFVAHREQHRLFVKELANLRELILNHDAAPSLAKFLTDWLLSHIKISDTEYARFFHERGFSVKVPGG